MKTVLGLVATAAIGCLLVSSVEAAPAKRQLSSLSVAWVQDEDSIDVIVTGDCESTMANVEYNFWVTVNYIAINEGPVTITEKGELENTIELAEVIGDNPDTEEIEECYTTGSTSFDLEAISDAIESFANSLVPVGAIEGGWEAGCQFLEAKAWTESNSVKDSKPTKAPVVGCEE